MQNAQLFRALHPNKHAQVQRGNKKKILVLKPSSRVAFESRFKTALNVRKNSKLDSVFNDVTCWHIQTNKSSKNTVSKCVIFHQAY